MQETRTTSRGLTVTAMLVVVAVLVGVAVFIGSGGAGSAARAGQRVTLSLYMSGTNQSNNLTQPPAPGQQNILGSDLYQLGGTDAAPAPTGDAIGRRVAVCTVVTPSEAICRAIVDLHDRGTLAAQLEVLLPGGNQGIAITGGTGEFAGAAGTITETMVPGQPNDRVLEVSITEPAHS